MLKDIVEVKVVGDTKLFLKFEDGKSGEVDLSEIIKFTGVFQNLNDPNFFKTVTVNPELGTITWPNGADLCPDVLYFHVTGEPIQVAKAQEAS